PNDGRALFEQVREVRRAQSDAESEIRQFVKHGVIVAASGLGRCQSYAQTFTQTTAKKVSCVVVRQFRRQKGVCGNCFPPTWKQRPGSSVSRDYSRDR